MLTTIPSRTGHNLREGLRIKTNVEGRQGEGNELGGERLNNATIVRIIDDENTEALHLTFVFGDSFDPRPPQRVKREKKEKSSISFGGYLGNAKN